MDSYLVIDSISKRFGTVQAVDRVSFTCRRGELVAILGPSGCGKTTLLRMIAGFEAPDAGSILLDGEPLQGMPPEARRVGLLFQNYALFPHMTVEQNIAYGLQFPRPKRAQEVRARVEALLDLVELPGYQDRRPDQLSAGQQQRVAIARALAPEPRLLLLDEPLSALDVALREHLRLNIRRIQRELGLTTLYVTHDQEEALSIADRIVVMHGGRVEQFGTPKEVYERPATRFVATFFGRTALVPTHLFPPDTQYLTGRGTEHTHVVLRAEQVHPHTSGLPLRGVLEDVEYLGHVTRLRIRCDSGLVWATAPGTQIDHWTGRRGKEVTVYFDPEQAATLPGEGDDGPDLERQGKPGFAE